MKKLTLLVLAGMFMAPIWSQTDTPFDKKLFKDKKDEFKEAMKSYEEGDENFFAPYSGHPRYGQAIEPYEAAYAFNPNSAELNYKLGVCHLYTLHKYKSLDLFKKAYKLNPNVHPEIHYYLGCAYHIQYKFDQAIDEYEKYRKSLGPINKDNAEKIDEATKKLEECETGKKMYANPVRVWIDNLGFAVNSEAPEYSPLIATDESLIFFTSRREDTQGGGISDEDDEFYEDVYYAEFKDGIWQDAQNMGELVNSDRHDATAGLSPDGKTLFIYSDGEGYGDIYMSKFVEGEWSKLKHLGKNINDKNAHETSACLSYDGKTLFFVSNREGGHGEHDIYKSQWDENKERWGEAENLGPTINTKYDEAGAFIHPDGKTLYFASKGHKTMGGFDIFSSKLQEDGSWTTPENVGYPVCTPDDDVHFVVSANGRTGYYASFQSDGLGEKDLYKVTFLGPEKEPLLNNEDNLIASIAAPITEKVVVPKVEVSRSDVAVLKGRVLDAKTLKPLASKIEIMDNETNTLVSEITTDAATGKYLVTLPSGKNYGMAVKAEGYLFHSENFLLPEASGYREYKKDVLMKKVSVGEKIVLRNIFYDLNKATLRPESKTELERLIQLMNDNPTLKIELSGHTDSRGDAAYNMKLSKDRAASVVKYLVEHGIPASRLESAGYGETQLIHTDAEIYKLPTVKREELHQENRRTEFKILAK